MTDNTKQRRADKKLLEQQIDNVYSLTEQVVEDMEKVLKAAQNSQDLAQEFQNIKDLARVEDMEKVLKAAQNAQEFQNIKDLAREFENIKEQVKNINLEDDKIHEILKDFDYNQLENETKLKLKIIKNFFFVNAITFYILNI